MTVVTYALLALGLTAAAAGSSARCILRRKNIPAESAKEVAVILSGALFLVYFFAALLAYFFAAPQAAESFRQLLAQPGSPASAPGATASPQPAALPQGKMPAEQDRAERLLLLAETEELLHRETDARYQLFGQEHAYIVAEGISGIEDRYIPPRPEQLAPAADPAAPALPQQSISVRELVSSFDDISSILPPPQEPPAPAQAVPQQNPPAQQLTPPVAAAPPPSVPAQIFPPPEHPAVQQTAPAAPVSSGTPPAMQELPSASGIDQQIRAQEQGVQQVACEEIRRSMDSTDLGVFRYAVTKPAGVVTPWKGPTGSYAVTAGAGAQGGCRDYALQAELRGRILRCQFSCARTTTGSPAQASRPARPPRSGKEVIREAMNSSDQETFLQALNYHGPISWRSSSGIFYTVAPVRLGNPCREYEVQANIQGRVFRYLESNCE